MKKIFFISIFSLFLNCKKEDSLIIEKKQLSKEIIKDTIKINIDSNYNLEISKDKKINFFAPIKDKLKNEEIYPQIIYDKKNIIINLEIGENANLFEDIYISKSLPIRIEKIIRTTITKTSPYPEKLECEEIFNEVLTPNSRYLKINDNNKDCKSKKME